MLSQHLLKTPPVLFRLLRSFPVHNFLLGAGRYGLTQLANVDQLPTHGALIVVAPLKLVRGTGAPSRVLAFVAG